MTRRLALPAAIALLVAVPAFSSRTATQPASPEQRQARVAAVLARPLFTPGRIPPRSEPALPAEPVPPPRLTGLIVMDHARQAIFAAPNGSKPVVVGEGGRLGPFTVTAIGSDKVDLAGPLGMRTLHPSSDIGQRLQFASVRPIETGLVLALIDPVRREAETENDQ